MNRCFLLVKLSLCAMVIKAAMVIMVIMVTTVQADDNRPNMLVVLVDDHAFEAISCYGGHLKDFARTPTIDRIANEGMRFDSMTVATSICSPSRAAILTGQFGHINGVKGLGGKINDASPQYPVYLQKAGYQTMLVGKWHLGSQPKGYEKYMVVKGQGKYFNPSFTGTEGSWKKEGYATDVYTDIALDWLKQRNKKKPFLMSLQFKAPHHEYGHAERYDDLLADTVIAEPQTLYDDFMTGDSNLKREFIKRTKFHMARSGLEPGGYFKRHLNDPAPNQMGKHDPDSEKDRIRAAYQHMIRKYIRCITGSDDNLKRVMDYLDSEGITDDTVIIYTADQGYWLGQHGMYDKRLALETSVRMPFVIRYPKLIKAGSENLNLCMNVDVAPTLLEIAGESIPKTMQGKSMVPLLKGEAIAPGQFRSSQFYSYWGAPGHYGVRNERYTFVRIPGYPDELFDRKTDPHQKHNVAGNPEYKQVMTELAAELERQIEAVKIDQKSLPTAKGLKKEKKKRQKGRKKKAA